MRSGVHPRARRELALTTVILAALTGSLAGLAHVLSAPDHMAAVAPFSIEARHRAWALGVRWGIGHSAGLVGVGALAYAVKDWLDAEWMSRLGGYGIGLILIGIGLWGLRHLRSYEHEAEDAVMHAIEADVPSVSASAPARAHAPHVHTHVAFGVGVVHAVAGTGQILGVVPVLAMPQWSQAVGYLTGFAAGNIAAMTAFAGLLGVFAAGRTAQGLRGVRRLFAATSAATLAIGVVWIALTVAGVELHEHAPAGIGAAHEDAAHEEPGR